MQQKEAQEGIIPTASRQILLVFSTPRTPKQAVHDLSVKKLRLGDFLKRHLLKCLNPDARKDWECIGLAPLAPAIFGFSAA